MKPSTILKKAKRKISNPKRWCQKYLARLPSGVPCDPELTRVKQQWCALGAVLAVDWESELDVRWYLRNAIPHGSRATRVSDYNDHPRRTHAQIMKLYDRAIALALKDEACA
jgi:hypothetical protein